MLSQGIRIINNKHLLKTTDMRDRKMFLLRWSHASVNIITATSILCTYVICDDSFFNITAFFVKINMKTTVVRLLTQMKCCNWLNKSTLSFHSTLKFTFFTLYVKVSLLQYGVILINMYLL